MVRRQVDVVQAGVSRCPLGRAKPLGYHCGEEKGTGGDAERTPIPLDFCIEYESSTAPRVVHSSNRGRVAPGAFACLKLTHEIAEAGMLLPSRCAGDVRVPGVCVRTGAPLALDQRRMVSMNPAKSSTERSPERSLSALLKNVSR